MLYLPYSCYQMKVNEEKNDEMLKAFTTNNYKGIKTYPCNQIEMDSTSCFFRINNYNVISSIIDLLPRYDYKNNVDEVNTPSKLVECLMNAMEFQCAENWLLSLELGLPAYIYTESIKDKAFTHILQDKIDSAVMHLDIMRSINIMRLHSTYNEKFIDAKNLLNLKKLQATLVKELSESNIDIHEWIIKDFAYFQSIQRLQDRLMVEGFKTSIPLMTAKEIETFSVENYQMVHEAIKALSLMGKEYNEIVSTSKKRLLDSYY